MKLSKRLNAIYEMITPGLTIADIGTDHGYIPVQLALEGRTDKALAMDVAKGPLQRAEESIARYNVADKVEARLSDGLAALGEGETEGIVIAGMGGPLMVRILADDIQKAHAAKELILSPHSEIERVRLFLYENDFAIVDETIVKDEGKYYFVMKVVNGGMEKPCDENLYFGSFLAQRQDEIMHEYLDKEEILAARILDNLCSNSNGNEERISEIKNRLDLIRKAKKYYDC